MGASGAVLRGGEAGPPQRASEPRGLPSWLLWLLIGLLGCGATIAILAFQNIVIFGSAAAIILFVLIWRPQLVLGLYPIIMLTLPVLSRGTDTSSTGIRADQLLLLLALLSAVGYMVAHRLPLPVNHILLAYAIYLAFFLVSIAFSKFALGYTASTLDIIAFAGLSRPFFIMLIFMLLINTVRRAWIVVGAVIYTGIAILALGFGQLMQIPIVTAATLFLYNRKRELEDWELFKRITATFDGQSNQAGFFGYMYIGLLAGLLLCLPRPQLKRYGIQLSILLFAAMLFLLGTGSRAALAGLLLAAAIVVFMAGQRNLIILSTSGLLAALSIGLIASPLLFSRLMEVLQVLSGGNIDLVVGRRFVQWSDILHSFFWPSPLLGSGANTFTADSSYVAELCLRGICGLIAYCLLLLVVARAAYVTWKQGTHPLGRALGVCVLVTTVGIIVQGFSIVVLAGRPAELYWLLVACMWQFYPAQQRIRLGSGPVGEVVGDQPAAASG